MTYDLISFGAVLPLGPLKGKGDTLNIIILNISILGMRLSPSPFRGFGGCLIHFFRSMN